MVIALSEQMFLDASRALEKWKRKSANEDDLANIANFTSTVIHELAHVRQLYFDKELVRELEEGRHDNLSDDEYLISEQEIDALRFSIRFIMEIRKRKDADLWKAMDFSHFIGYFEETARALHNKNIEKTFDTMIVSHGAGGVHEGGLPPVVSEPQDIEDWLKKKREELARALAPD